MDFSKQSHRAIIDFQMLSILNKKNQKVAPPAHHSVGREFSKIYQCFLVFIFAQILRLLVLCKVCSEFFGVTVRERRKTEISSGILRKECIKKDRNGYVRAKVAVYRVIFHSG